VDGGSAVQRERKAILSAIGGGEVSDNILSVYVTTTGDEVSMSTD
jgi:hypothetical protein